MEHAFDRGHRFTLGLEEEVFLVDPESRALVNDAERVLAGMGLEERLAGHEAFASEIELRSDPAATAGEAVEFLSAGRAAACETGIRLIAAGLHPDSGWGEAQIVDSERYRRVLATMRGLIQRMPECALHVHVGMPDEEAAVRAFNALRGSLPLLAGLCGSSPFWLRRDSGLASARAAIVRAYPARGVPRPLRDLEDYATALAETVRGGGPDDYTMLWWDVRLQPRFGTVEVREMDAQPRLADVAAVAELIQGIAIEAVERPVEPSPGEAIAWSQFHAQRDGLDARILHEGRLMGLREAAREAAGRAREHLRQVGGGEAIEGIERIVSEGASADRQRAAHAEGGLGGLLRHLSDETSSRFP